MVRVAALVVLALGAPALAGCSKSEPGLKLEGVDRSDGEIPTLEIPRLDGPPSIDGELDDAAWKKGASTGPFVHPGDGKVRPRSKVNAEALLGWDDQHLYVAVRVFDDDPVTPFSRDADDPHVWSKASGIELMLQPGERRDNRRYFEIQVDSGGAIWDTRFDDYNRPITGEGGARRFGHQDWSAKLERATGRKGGSYVVEMALPWASLAEVSGVDAPPKAGERWRLNLYSFRDGQRDSLAWSPILGKGNFHRTSRFGVVRFGK